MDANPRLNRCESCNKDISQCATIYCHSCDESVDKATIGDEPVRCPKCQNDSRVVEIPDDTQSLCKYCLNAAMDDSLTSLPNMERKTDCQPTPLDTQALKRSVSTPVACPPGAEAGSEIDSLIACCHRCKIRYPVFDEVASCVKCGREADSFEEKEPPNAASVDCSGDGSVKAEDSKPDVQPPWMKDHTDEFWRFVGCICQNNEPFCFDLQQTDSLKKSFYCLDCQLPYGRCAFKAELSGEHCPKCSSDRVEIDEIAAGEEVVICQNCDGEVSKRRIDLHCSNVGHDVQRQLDEEHLKQLDTVCTRCGHPGADIGFDGRKGHLWLVQSCNACGCCEPISDIEAEQNPPEEVPDGFAELEQHCCGLAKLHPVVGDSDDNLLECACGKSGPLCLAGCRHPNIPKTVKDLRETLKSTYSSGEMGLPFRTERLRDAANLQPGDHLDFDRGIYAHHALVVEVVKTTQQVALIEYTGEIDGRTAKAALTSGTKGSVERTLHPYADIVKDGRLVQYHSLDCFRPAVVLQRAFERHGEQQYNVGQRNCEHFCSWAKTGLDISRQVDGFKKKAMEVLGSPIVDNVLKGVAQLGFGSKRVHMAVEIVQDLRRELMDLFNIQKDALGQTLRMALRLGLKWGIRGLPLLFSFLTRQTKFLDLLPELDAYVMKPLAEAVMNKLLPIKDKDSDDKK